MTHTYDIQTSSQTDFQSMQQVLAQVDGVQTAQVDPATGKLTITMSRHIPGSRFNQALTAAGLNTQLTNEQMLMETPHQSGSSSWKDYWPLILILLYVLGGSLVLAYPNDLTWMVVMQNFMGLFFVFFSLFKLLDLKGFAEGYATYDLLAKRWMGWGFVYPFVELGLAVAYLTSLALFWTNLVTFGVMVFGAVGVARELLRGSQFQCACLGTVLKVPLTKVTLVEDLAMAIMAAVMLVVGFFG
jgi:hypothetical protein